MKEREVIEIMIRKKAIIKTRITIDERSVQASVGHDNNRGALGCCGNIKLLHYTGRSCKLRRDRAHTSLLNYRCSCTRLVVVSVVSGGENGGHDVRCTDGFPSPKSGPPGTTDIKQPA